MPECVQQQFVQQQFVQQQFVQQQFVQQQFVQQQFVQQQFGVYNQCLLNQSADVFMVITTTFNNTTYQKLWNLEQNEKNNVKTQKSP